MFTSIPFSYPSLVLVFLPLRPYLLSLLCSELVAGDGVGWSCLWVGVVDEDAFFHDDWSVRYVGESGEPYAFVSDVPIKGIKSSLPLSQSKRVLSIKCILVLPINRL